MKMSNKITTKIFIERENFLKSSGFNFVSIWEDDYKKGNE